ncbi:UvrD-helicase domain-containing protein [Acinetobacter bereziniae]|uniref:UvrD-helicase domain-containing protein n=1 Tax=Acinetobacter bereziniae TaxID=106648 RepID=UPI00125FD397|nr:UvrD-helicase domain-containing protein [Acinetobacter bereziniae]MBJ8552333.1 ATP-dependent helicase [Acinetobacter bereziniae]
MITRIETTADNEIKACLAHQQNFALIAGAGSGKTSSLVDALKQIRENEGKNLRQNGQSIACITYTKRAVEVIKSRLGFDDLFTISTLHSFLWNLIKTFQSDIRKILKEVYLPILIENTKSKDNGGNSQIAIKARTRVYQLELELSKIDTVKNFNYADNQFSNYSNGQLSHDDIIEISIILLKQNQTFRKILGLRFPYIFIDEAQDTYLGIIEGLNLVCAEDGVPLIGYFGDPWQQIYDDSAGNFSPPANGKIIKKTENFRCSKNVIRLLNSFRKDVSQYPAGENKEIEGSVIFRLIQTETPEMPRKKYSEDQITRALLKMDTALEEWGWSNQNNVIKLFLVRQMIARRMGFSELNKLFNGPFSSSRSEDAFEAGEHFALNPIISTIYPLIVAKKNRNYRDVIDILRNNSPAFSIDGLNASRSLKVMIDHSNSLILELERYWNSSNIKQILEFCVSEKIINISERLMEHLQRSPRIEVYDEEIHEQEKEDWLLDKLFQMNTSEIEAYATFIAKNSSYSTQHGVKGEEYPRVLVVYDDIEASWSNYNFGKILTPNVSGLPTPGQQARGEKLAYVAFSRALEDLRVIFFTPNPEIARNELIERGLLLPEQIEIA